MRSFTTTRWLAAGVLLFLAAPQATLALTLDDLNGGGSFDSLDQTLNFSFDPNSISVSGSVGGALSDFEVVLLDDGFQIVGPFTTFDGETGSLWIDYTVTGTPDALAEAILSFNGAAAGQNAVAIVDEILGQEGTAEVHAREGDLKLFDSVLLTGTPQSLEIMKHIALTSVAGGTAQISEVKQRFTPVPEPGTVGLLLLGVGGLAYLRRRR
jgi:hypothetical protein